MSLAFFPAPPTITVKIAGVDLLDLIAVLVNSKPTGHGLWANSLRISQLAEHRSTCEFILLTQQAIFVPEVGRMVEIFDQDGAKVFGGIIDEARQRIRGTHPGLDVTFGVDLEVHCLCVDWNQVLDTLYADMTVKPALPSVGEPGPPVATAGAAVRQLFTELNGPCPILTGEGFRLVTVQEGAKISEEIFDRVPVSRILQRLAELSQDGDGNSYTWWIDPGQGVHFVPRSVEAAPFGLTDAGGEAVFGTVELVDTRKDYANDVFLRFGGAAVQATVEFTGDNISRVFPRPDAVPPDPEIRPMRELVAVSLNGIPELVGLEPEVKNPGADWYWTPAGSSVRQSDAAPAAISSTDKLTVTYQAFGADLTESKNDGAIAADALLRSPTSGITQALIERTDLTDADEIQKQVDRLRDKMSQRGRTIKFRTYRRGLMPGQLLTATLTALNLSGETFVVDSVSVSDEDKMRLVYDVTAYRAERIRNSVDFFQALAGGASLSGSQSVQSAGQYAIVAVVPGALVAGNDIATHYPVRRAGSLVEWAATSKTAPTSDVILDVRVDNVSIFAAADRPRIVSGTSALATTVGAKFAAAALRVGDMVTVDCAQAGGANGVTLKLTVRT